MTGSIHRGPWYVRVYRGEQVAISGHKTWEKANEARSESYNQGADKVSLSTSPPTEHDFGVNHWLRYKESQAPKVDKPPKE